jgi:hypothetical protein
MTGSAFAFRWRQDPIGISLLFEAVEKRCASSCSGFSGIALPVKRVRRHSRLKSAIDVGRA